MTILVKMKLNDNQGQWLYYATVQNYCQLKNLYATQEINITVTKLHLEGQNQFKIH